MRDAKISELEMIALKPSFTYKVSELPSVQSQLIISLNRHKDTQDKAVMSVYKLILFHQDKFDSLAQLHFLIKLTLNSND